ncbi:hypothetical protein [Candidatus Laterigemmans baculatus]|uniref:hypothetical protein n=1 Tax=Candidatus Laterigemmans baculatus TaxID=2770505 RepID=UPI0013DB7B81|nr:hypothetical protein [Candidatus Laterigemmans baculatus]
MQRREFLTTAAALATTPFACPKTAVRAAEAPTAAEAILPRDRVPLSFIIDDSTCLVNMGHFCMPQFAAAWPGRKEYEKPWKSWPREIPDAFVRQFGQWCSEHGVKGKYSIVPNPACVGWLDRELPGWARHELRSSLQLVRELMVPNWDIHPEMITHTRVIDLKTGRPLEPANPSTMENSFPQKPISTDFLTEYLAYALRILRNCELPCEGVTTPGGFGNQVKTELGLAAFDAVRDVYGSELPHYFKYVSSGEESTEPRLEHVRDLDTNSPRVVVNVPAGTGDWFGGWDGVQVSQGHRYANHDATAGRMVELIERRQPAVMLCHWPGMYCNGSLAGFRDFQQVVEAIAGRFAEHTVWMKVSEIARYWAAKELTRLTLTETGLQLQAPFACPGFTVRLSRPAATHPRLGSGIAESAAQTQLSEVSRRSQLASGRWCRDGESTLACFDLPRGTSTLTI